MKTKVNKKEYAEDAVTMLLAMTAITVTLAVDVITSFTDMLRKK